MFCRKSKWTMRINKCSIDKTKRSPAELNPVDCFFVFLTSVQTWCKIILFTPFGFTPVQCLCLTNRSQTPLAVSQQTLLTSVHCCCSGSTPLHCQCVNVTFSIQEWKKQITLSPFYLGVLNVFYEPQNQNTFSTLNSFGFTQERTISS